MSGIISHKDELIEHIASCFNERRIENYTTEYQFSPSDSITFSISTAMMYPKHRLNKNEAVKEFWNLVNLLSDTFGGLSIRPTIGTFRNMQGTVEIEPSVELATNCIINELLHGEEQDLASVLEKISTFCDEFCKVFYQESVMLNIEGNNWFQSPTYTTEDYKRIRSNNTPEKDFAPLTVSDLSEIFRKFNNEKDSKESRSKIKREFLRFRPLIQTDGTNDNFLDDFKPPVILEGSEMIILEDVLRFQKPIMINGDGGVGKTTTAKILASMLIEYDNCLPVMITGRELEKNDWMSAEQVLSNSFKNLTFNVNQPQLESDYVKLNNSCDRIVLLFDQLDDIAAVEYHNHILDFITTAKDIFQKDKIHHLVFVRKFNSIANYRKISINTELSEIQEKLVKLGLDSETVGPKLNKVNQTMMKNKQRLVLADIPFLKRFFDDGNADFNPNRYPVDKALHIPDIIFKETGIRHKTCIGILNCAVAMQLFNQDLLDTGDIIHPIKKSFPDIDEDQIKDIIVHSRMFVEKNNLWEIDTHDTIRDFFASSFYTNQNIKKTCNSIIEGDYSHPLKNCDSNQNQDIIKRLLKEMSKEDYGGYKIPRLLGLITRICQQNDLSNWDLSRKKELFYDLFGTENNSDSYLRSIGYSENKKINSELLVDTGKKIWGFFGFNQGNSSHTKEYIEILAPCIDKEILDNCLNEDNTLWKGPMRDIMMNCSIGPDLWLEVIAS